MTSRTYESGKNNCTEVLEILDPDATGYIDIEEMKPLVAKLPQELQDPISELLRNYVFESHSFRISCDQFLQLYMNKLERKDSFTSTPSRRKSLADSFFRSSTSSFWPSRSTTMHESPKKSKRLRSFSPKKLNSYKELYQRKKSVESETWKKSTKLFDKIDSRMQTFNMFTEKSANFSIDKSTNRDYKFKYSNFNELVKIRQKHLALCNKYQK
ncbi:hypothetical protein SteCoe_31493 [Stentor coeruleus]|uniref:EF-hand domain-containing protein n=1 Tax=Stentor coeruleus TaxID=5963 RepID=A0A1R2B179_9CILI|nr:hypothetical protein SteCoe_31493 [Stentor coeruleus]